MKLFVRIAGIECQNCIAAPAAIGPHSQGIAAILHNHSAVVRQ